MPDSSLDIKPTPGPWAVDETCAGTLYIVSGDRGAGTQVDMAVMTDTHRQGGQNGAKANARLMAAAPDLLEVVQELLDYQYGHKGGLTATCRKAEKALAKATLLAEGE